MFRRFLPFRLPVLRRAPAPPDFALQALAPVTQARRCLDIWLAEEGRCLTQPQRHRAAALIARYFVHEDDISDALILSFLRHYSGRGVVDFDDPQVVRMELKAVLDRAQPAPLLLNRASRVRLAAVWVVTFSAVLTAAVTLAVARQPITPAQQHALRQEVAVAAVATGQPSARIWSVVKRDLGVMRYEDIRRHDYARARRLVAAQADKSL